MNLTLKVDGQMLHVLIPGRLVSGSIGYLDAVGVFSAEWEQLDKWVHFEGQNGIHYIRELSGDRAENLQLDAGEWKVWLHGQEITAGTPKIRMTTEIQRFMIHATGELENGSPLPQVQISAAEQIAANSMAALRIAREVRQDADSGRFRGPAGPRGPKGETGRQGPQGEAGLPGRDAAVDPSLSQTGKAADAAETGSRLRELDRRKQDRQGSYELIESSTLQKDEALLRNKEPDGTPYRFTALILKIDASGATGEKGVNTGQFAYSAGTDKMVAGSQINLKNYPICYMEVCPDRGVMRSRFAEAAGEDGLFQARLAEKVRVFMTPVQEIGKLNSFGNVYPAGTKIEIWAVRA